MRPSVSKCRPCECKGWAQAVSEELFETAAVVGADGDCCVDAIAVDCDAANLAVG